MKMSLLVFDLDDTILDTSRELLHIADTNQFLERIQQPLPMLEGAKANLDYFFAKIDMVLLTQGISAVQMQKIDTLKIAPYFKKIYCAEVQAGQSKLEFFRRILLDFSVDPQAILSIGNRRATDIRFAKQLGYKTCLIKYGEHFNEFPEQENDVADFEISHHKELISICQI